MKKWMLLTMVILLALSTLVAACGPTATPEPEPTTPPPPEATTPPEPEPTEPPEKECLLKVGMVSDVGGVDDASFNQNTWEGLVMAEEDLGICSQFIESQAQADYEKNITEFAEQDYDLIITVGYLLGDATAKISAEYPDIKFGIVDYAYDPGIPNVVGIVFATDGAAFMTGYLAAAWADLKDPGDPQVGYVAGMQIPTVEIFVAGHTAGVAYYNEKHGADVQISGTYVGDFEAPDEGKTQGLSLIDEGADVIFGIGGKTGNGGLVAAKEAGVWGVGVDVDQYFTLPNEKDILITSTIKRLDMAVFGVVESVLDGTFAGGGVYVGTLENGGVGMAPFHDYVGEIPSDIVAEIDEVRAGLLDGTIETGWEG